MRVDSSSAKEHMHTSALQRNMSVNSKLGLGILIVHLSVAANLSVDFLLNFSVDSSGHRFSQDKHDPPLFVADGRTNLGTYFKRMETFLLWRPQRVVKNETRVRSLCELFELRR